MLIGFNSAHQDGLRIRLSCVFSLCLCLTKLLQVSLTLPEAGALELTKFMRYYTADIRLPSQYDVMANMTLSECCLQCFADVTCMAVNYRSDLLQCELSAQGLCQTSTAAVDDSGWNIYMEYNQVRKRVKIRNLYNQAPHLAQDTNGIVTTSQLDITNEIEPIELGSHTGDLLSVYRYFASQSSEHSSRYRPAELALDGDYSTISVTTNKEEAWWSVRFCTNVVIARVKVWNRSDCCNEQLGPFDLFVDDKLCGKVSSYNIAKGAVVEITCTQKIIGSVLKLQRTVVGHLNIAEVQIYSS